MNSEPRTHKRKPHHKVRTGCENCKRRRTKCDEAKPACSRCRRAGLLCSGYNAPKAWLFDPSGTNTQSSSELEFESTLLDSSLSSSAIDLPNAWMLHSHGRPPAPSFTVVPNFFEYVQGAYPPSEVTRVSHLFQFVLAIFGPCFIWNRHSDTEEQHFFTSKFLYHCMHEPALLEGVFAVSSQQEPIRESPQKDSRALLHYNRSLALLQKRLSSSSAPYDDSIFWTIVAVLIVSRERGDTKSFGVHLTGLRRIVSLRGGSDTMRLECPRAFTFVLWAESCHAKHQKSHNRSKATPPAAGLPKTSSKSTESDTFLPETSSTPPEFQRLIIDRHIRPAMITIAHGTTVWYETYTKACTSSIPESIDDSRMALAKDLDNISRRNTPTPDEHLFCVGMFILVISLPPSCLVEQFPTKLCVHLTSLTSASPDTVDEACYLWVALLTASLPDCFDLSAELRWWLLERYIKHTAGLMKWENAEKKVTGFICPPILRDQWPMCWITAFERAYPTLSTEDHPVQILPVDTVGS